MLEKQSHVFIVSIFASASSHTIRDYSVYNQAEGLVLQDVSLFSSPPITVSLHFLDEEQRIQTFSPARAPPGSFHFFLLETSSVEKKGGKKDMVFFAACVKSSIKLTMWMFEELLHCSLHWALLLQATASPEGIIKNICSKNVFYDLVFSSEERF